MSEEKTEVQPVLEPQKFYLKDVSFESPNAPEVFKEENEPKSEFNINTGSTKLDEGIYEVTLKISAKVSNDSGTIFLVELEQAGIFTVANFPEEQMGHLLNAYCANILFPYAREEISSLTTKGGFPPLLLAPINFDALYEQRMQSENDTQH